MKKLFTFVIFLCSIFTASATLNYFDKYLQDARDGNPEGMFFLGLSYYVGEDFLPKDKNRACQWFMEASRRGYAPSMTFSGVCYYFGQGVPVNYDKALEWLHKAHDLGETDASYYLAICYHKLGNYKSAFEYYVESLKTGGGARAASEALIRYYRQGLYVEVDYAKVAKLQKISDLYLEHKPKEAMALIHELYGY